MFFECFVMFIVVFIFVVYCVEEFVFFLVGEGVYGEVFWKGDVGSVFLGDGVSVIDGVGEVDGEDFGEDGEMSGFCDFLFRCVVDVVKFDVFGRVFGVGFYGVVEMFDFCVCGFVERIGC